MEIITGVERRRRWRLGEKLRILAETEAPGACIAEVARRHDVSRGLLWTWRQQARKGRLAAGGMAEFLPVQVVPAAVVPMAAASTAAVAPHCRTGAAETTIEIGLPDGTLVRVGQDVGAVALRRVLGVLRR